MAMTVLIDLVARAGGGHSFSGGGGSSRSSGGGGGGFFFLGGGGGGGGGIIGIIFLIVLVLIVVAIVAAVRRGRMGGGSAIDAATQGYGGTAPRPSQWSGSDQSAAIDSIRGDVFPGTDAVAHTGATPVEDGLAQIQAHDPEFNEEIFLEQVQKAFFMVEEAWTERKPDLSRRVMADGIWQTHRTQIEQYVSEHKRNVLEDLAVGDLRVLSAHSDQTYDTVTVRVFAACADYDVNDQSGKSIRGDRSVGQWQEDWTFQRSSAATTKPGGGTFMSNKCPNCGAPLDVDLQGVCKFCHQPIMSGKFDWVLARIAQVM